jgi:deazaflavin-dependent oxidoreductase (nitroreductase family)
VARQYRVGFARRLINRLVTRSVGRGKGDDRFHLLTTIGRKTGAERTTPVSLVEIDGSRWLVAPYGHVGWVHNIRASGSATIKRGEKTERINTAQASAEEAAPVLAHYLETTSIVRPYFEVSYDSPLSDIAAVADRHPVFRIG